MKRPGLFILTLFVLVTPSAGAERLTEFLEQIGAVSIRTLQPESIYEEILEIMIEQPLDHRYPEGKRFLQRIYVSHRDTALPVVFVTAGYHANYYYTAELAAHLRSNQIMAEHRYFGKSQPDSLDWEYLDTWQAASDHHRIVQIFRELYPKEWISTGISKGGQTVMYHSYYYPEDVQVRVPYVAPLNFSVEDDRIYTFLERVGTPSERRKVKRFQKRILRHQERYLPAFREFSAEQEYTYEIAGGPETAFEYCVLEYSFAFWQWGYVQAKDIPGPMARPRDVIIHMNRVAGFDYFADRFIEEYRPFFYQALTEMGYYGYDLEEFGRHLRHVENPVFTFTLEGVVDTAFDPVLSRDLERYLTQEAERFIYIYGELDTWSATALEGTGTSRSRIFYKEGGSHRTRIYNMPEGQQEEVFRTLEQYLEEASATAAY